MGYATSDSALCVFILHWLFNLEYSKKVRGINMGIFEKTFKKVKSGAKRVKVTSHRIKTALRVSESPFTGERALTGEKIVGARLKAYQKRKKAFTAKNKRIAKKIGRLFI
jgi:hypothetical protein